jgi:hypothetical protein
VRNLVITLVFILATWVLLGTFLQVRRKICFIQVRFLIWFSLKYVFIQTIEILSNLKMCQSLRHDTPLRNCLKIKYLLINKLYILKMSFIYIQLLNAYFWI